MQNTLSSIGNWVDQNKRFDEIQIKDMGYSDEFLRMWDYYFIYCEAGFRERFIGDVQLVMAKPSNKNIQINY